MLWFDVLAIGAPVMVLVTSAAYYAGRRRERRELWPEAAAAERYKLACRDVLTWCCQDEFRGARLVAGHIMDRGEGVGPINAGTPHGDETCTVNGLREQLRRSSRAPAEPTVTTGYAQVIDGPKPQGLDWAEPAAPDVVEAPIYNPWRKSLENCISGDNYLRASEYRELIAELDDLYRMRAALSTPARRDAQGLEAPDGA